MVFLKNGKKGYIMAVFRIEKTKNYIVMSNYHLKEKDMSLKAKGLLSLMLSLPEDWDYSIKGLVSICKEKESAIISTLTELKRFGYLKVNKLMPNETKSGRIEYEYIIYEIPQKQHIKKQDIEKQDIEKQDLENQGLENQVQLNINNKIKNIKYLNLKLVNKNKKIINKFKQGYNNACARVSEKSTEQREPYIKYYGDFFNYTLGEQNKLREVGYEIIDTMIEANECAKETGLKFKHKNYSSKELVKDIYLNVDTEKFKTIVKQVAFNDGIKNRPYYILGCIFTASINNLQKNNFDFKYQKQAEISF